MYNLGFIPEGSTKYFNEPRKVNKMRKACLISVACLLLASLALAQTKQTKQGRTTPNAIKGAPTTCGADPVLSSDGTVTSEDFIAVASAAYYTLNVKGGHSYSIEVWDPFDPTAGVSPAIGLLATDCTTKVTSTDVTNMDPDLGGGFSDRISWIQGSDATIHIAVNNPDQNNGYTFYIRVTDTTLFNPRWSTFSGYASTWGLTNTTPTDISGTMTVIDSSGSVLATYPATFKAAQPTFLTTVQLSIPANHSGYANFTYVGPPGAFVADGFMISPSGDPIIPVLFVDKHAYH